MPVSIKTDAPVVVRLTRHIDAPPEVVWARLADLTSWPSWNTGVTKVTVNGPVDVGTDFTWKNGPTTIRSTLLACQSPTSLAWSGRTVGIDAVHVYRFAASNDGGTDVETEESWSGLLPRLLRGPLRKVLTKALETGLDALQASTTAHP